MAVNCGVGHRRSLVAVAMAAAPICPLAWDLPNALGVALKDKKKKKKKERGEKERPREEGRSQEVEPMARGGGSGSSKT